MENQQERSNSANKFKNSMEKLIDLIFNMKKETLYLIIIAFLALTLRIIAAINMTVSADDMHHVAHAINFYGADRLITYDQSSGLWHAFTSIIYNLFGMTQFTSRFASILFGSLSALATYLLAREFFNEKVSLISAFLLSIATFHIQNTMPEMDVTAMFFTLIGMMLFVRALKTDKSKYFVISGVFFGLAVYTKIYPLLFIPSMLLYFIYTKKKEQKKILLKRSAIQILIFLFAVFILTIPVLTHNYLLYKDKGFLDLQFTRTLGLGKNISEQYYGWDHQFNAKNDWKGLILGNSSNSSSKKPTLLVGIDFVRLTNPLIFYLGTIGIILILFKRKEYKAYLVFSLLAILFALPFLASIILLPKHYLFLELMLIPASALTVSEFSNKLSKLIKKETTGVVLVFLLLISLILLGSPPIKDFYAPNNYHYYGKSYVQQIIEFKEEKIPDDSLIIGDSRIYRGTINWVFQGRPYLEGTDFISILNSQNKIQGETSMVEVFYFECVPDDCGWGTVKDQPKFNESMESLASFFISNGRLIDSFKAPIEKKNYYPIFTSNNKEEIIRVYETKMPLKNLVLEFAVQPKNWFLYDIGYEPRNKQFDYYATHNNFDAFLDKVAHWIVTLALILAFASPIYILYLTFKK